MMNTRVSTSGRLTAAPARCAPASVAPRLHRRVHRLLRRAEAALNDAALVPVMDKGEMTQYPEAPGVYAVYNAAGELQYVGLSRKVRLCVCELNLRVSQGAYGQPIEAP